LILSPLAPGTSFVTSASALSTRALSPFGMAASPFWEQDNGSGPQDSLFACCVWLYQQALALELEAIGSKRHDSPYSAGP
jgi:hypothetical protein